MVPAPRGARLPTRLNCQTLRRALGVFLCCVAPLVPLKVPLQLPRLSNSGPSACKAFLAALSPTEHSAFWPLPLQAYLLSRAEAAPAPDLDSGGGPAAAALAAPPPDGGGNGSPDEETASAVPSFSLEALRGLVLQQAEAVAAMGPAAAAALVTTGATAGLASGLLGIGGGTLVTPILALLPMAYTQATVVGTSLAAMIPPSAVALAQHHRLGNVDWRMAAGLAIGTAVGGTVGSAAAVQLPTGKPASCVGLRACCQLWAVMNALCPMLLQGCWNLRLRLACCFWAVKLSWRQEQPAVDSICTNFSGGVGTPCHSLYLPLLPPDF